MHAKFHAPIFLWRWEICNRTYKKTNKKHSKPNTIWWDNKQTYSKLNTFHTTVWWDKNSVCTLHPETNNVLQCQQSSEVWTRNTNTLSIWLGLNLPSVLWRCWLGRIRKGIRPVNNWVVGYWCGYLSRARCTYAYSPADANASHSLASVKSRLVLLFWYRLTQVVPHKGP